MKLILIGSFLALGSLGMTAMAGPNGDTSARPTIGNEINLPAEHIFIPGSFDSNDVTEVIVKGTLSSSCCKVGNASATIVEAEHLIRVQIMGYKIEGAVCIPVTSTFLQSVKLGQLPAGRYKAVVNKDKKEDIEKEFSVTQADSATQDEHLYAQVDSIHLIKGKQFPVGFEIQGRIPPMNGECMDVGELNAEFDAEDVLAVLPILKRGEITDCTEDELANGRPFFRRMFQTEHPAAFLIHVRSLNGQSVNRYVPATTPPTIKPL